LKRRRMNRSTERSLITRRRSRQRIWYDGRNWTARTFYNEGASYRRSSKSETGRYNREACGKHLSAKEALAG
jgi:hypothetical protein